MLPKQYEREWNEWKESLSLTSGLSIPRPYRPKGFGIPTKIELHVFADASLQATGHTIYLRSMHSDSLHVELVTASSKLTPRQAHTIPRLELCAALDATVAAKDVSSIVGVSNRDVFLYSDSTVVLGYIRNTHRRFSGYISRRVNLIINCFSDDQWNYVPTELNPADLASRPQTSETLKHSIWFRGPSFLWTHEGKPEESPELVINDGDLPEQITATKVLRSAVANPIPSTGLLGMVHRTSDWDKAIRICDLAIKFVSILLKGLKRQKSRSSNCPSTDSAQIVLIRTLQEGIFGEVIRKLRNCEDLESNHPLVSLCPFLDANGTLRVGGRLRNSELEFDQKYPILLPPKNHVTTLIIRKYHKSTFHQGRVITQGALRAAGYFVHHGSREIKDFLKTCVQCNKLRGKFLTQIMSDLPSDRLERTPPFRNVGMDVFGPYRVTDGVSTRRNFATKKCWVLICTCLVSRAVHLEPLPSLDIVAFKNAFRRFTCIRGQCKIIRTDRGTNFVGAFNQTKDTELQNILQNEEVKWIFNPPKAPHFGGVFERKIGAVKRVLDGCLQQASSVTLSRDEFTTFLAEAASVVNSTPMSAISSDPNDPLPISPSTLLLQREECQDHTLEDFTESDLLSYGRRRWRRVQFLASQFWECWRRDYVQSLTHRYKWNKERKSLQIGDVVLIKDDLAKRNAWPIGRVKSVKSSSDGYVRSVTLTLPRHNRSPAERELERPISQLVPLYLANPQV